ncbi:unnamed protein product, partial [Mesorhabditis belari]|uniref:Phospholipid-transporting ATPase n=1 Tax=Mesorhabditis belari TaxID=2138241 RepID=A0AAF3FCP2_9BILA
MTVIVRTPEGKLCLFVKGADVKIMEMLSPSSDPKVRSTTQAHLKEFANLGYRTLCFAYRDLDEEEYRNWAQIWSRANCELYDREEAIEKAAKIVEKEFILLGASAIEDKLQERVPQTIARMLQADIRVWVLTGDKLETALNIGYSCSLISSKMPTMILATNTEEETAAQLEKYVNALGSKRLDSRDVELALIVDAMCLDWILKSQVMRMDFLRLALCCSAVICCRCTPLQKAAVTRLVKHNVDGQVLAVGDGANDVAMIQEANIGIGIAGVEGGQASMAADFAITQFRHLDRLLFVHGTCCFHRITTVVLFSLYKNLFEVLLHVLYAFYNGHSASGMSDEVLMVRYNLLYTSVTVAILGIHDTPAPLHVMSKYPRLYTHFQDNMNIRNHLSWSANALLHAFLLFHTTLYFWKYGTGAFRNGRDGWGQMVGSYMYLCLVVIVNLKAMIESRSINILTVAGFLGSILTALIMLATDSVVATLWSFPIVIPSQAHYLGLLWALPSVQTTAFLPLICVICLLPDVAWKAISRTLDPSLLQHVVQSMKVNDNVLDMVIKQPLIKIADVVGLKSHLESGKYGFMFAQDDGHVMTQADLLRMYGAADCIPETQTPASPVGKTTFLSETSSLKSLSLGADGPSNENRESRLTTKDSGAKCVVLDETV